MKKVMFLLLSSIFFICEVSAYKYTCNYTFKSYGDYDDIKYKIEYNIDTDSASILDKKKSTLKHKKTYEFHSVEGEISSLKNLKTDEDDRDICPTLYMSMRKVAIRKNTRTRYAIYTDSYVLEQKWGSCVANRDQLCIEKFLGVATIFYDGHVDDTSKKEVQLCFSYDNVKQNLDDAVKKYESCDSDSCRVSQRGIINTEFKNIKNVCQILLQYRNIKIKDASGNSYTDDECIKKCLNLDDEFSDIQNKFIDDDNGECGFSDKLLVIINNILRWIKYILPAIVIILGIIDFIKAIASDKEDEMKKAQKRFIIRLISAALVFIVPLIITFILDKMGFTANSCGIDLFK